MKRLLLLSDWFDPAYKAGGPIRSAVNFVKQMKDDYEIFILTSDRDLNDMKPLIQSLLMYGLMIFREFRSFTHQYRIWDLITLKHM